MQASVDPHAGPACAWPIDAAPADDDADDPAAMLPAEATQLAPAAMVTPQLPAIRPSASRQTPAEPARAIAHGRVEQAPNLSGPGLSAAADPTLPAAAAAAAAVAGEPPGPPPASSSTVAQPAATDAAAQAAVPTPAMIGPPAAQLGHAVAALRVGADGSSQLTIRLDPAELGQVQVQIQRGHDGGSSVSVAVERADTLGRLQADLAHLHQALDRAGVPEQRSLVLHLAPRQDAGAAASGDPAAGAATFGSQSAGSQSSGGQGGQSGNPQHSARRPADGGIPGTAGSAEAAEAPAAMRHSVHRVATGINITA